MPNRFLSLLFFVALAGCNKSSAPASSAAKPVEVVVDHPTVENITDTEEFPGRLEPVNAVDVRSRVTGYLDKIHFVDGADVKAGDPLFDIDPLLYAAEANRTQAAVTQAEAKRDRLKKDFDRVQMAAKGALSTEELDRITGDLAEAEAAVKVAIANMQFAQTNLAYTKVLAKITGRISQRKVDVGNLIKADDTILTTILSLDPIYASFDVDERTLLRLEGAIVSYRQDKIEVGVALSDDEAGKFPRTGVIDFADNRVNPRTGTIRVRAVIPNANKHLSPGLYVRLRFPVGKPHKSILVPDEAIGSDQGQKYVFLVNEKDEVVYRKVTLGPLSGKNRVIESGLAPGDRLIVGGIQRVRPGVKVAAKSAERPATDDTSSSPATTAAAGRE